MAISDKLWDALTTVIKMNDKIERMAGQMQTQQQKIEDLTGRVIRLETALEISIAGKGQRSFPKE
ncbi:MAG: hypothetical protein H0V78_04105 [Burkholderiales bacterium]|nr:hypothetical protein [Burkholderiales bacterium]